MSFPCSHFLSSVLESSQLLEKASHFPLGNRNKSLYGFYFFSSDKGKKCAVEAEMVIIN